MKNPFYHSISFYFIFCIYFISFYHISCILKWIWTAFRLLTIWITYSNSSWILNCESVVQIWNGIKVAAQTWSLFSYFPFTLVKCEKCDEVEEQFMEISPGRKNVIEQIGFPITKLNKYVSLEITFKTLISGLVIKFLDRIFCVKVKPF